MSCIGLGLGLPRSCSSHCGMSTWAFVNWTSCPLCRRFYTCADNASTSFEPPPAKYVSSFSPKSFERQVTLSHRALQVERTRHLRQPRSVGSTSVRGSHGPAHRSRHAATRTRRVRPTVRPPLLQCAGSVLLRHATPSTCRTARTHS